MANPSTFQVLLGDQLILCGSISKTITNLKKKGKINLTRSVLHGRLKTLGDSWTCCRSQHAQLELLVSDAERKSEAYFNEDCFSVTEENYLDAVDFINDLLSTEPNPTQSLATTAHHQEGSLSVARLPRIEIPSFSGSYMDWASFRDLFESLVVKNKSLSNVEKLQYLKVSLSGEAAGSLKNVTVTEANYERAWNDLKERYENTRAIINAYLRALFTVASVGDDVLAGLKQVRDTAVEVTAALENLGRPVQHWGDLLVFLLVQKIDTQSLQEWETSLGDSTDYPDFKKLKSFLDVRIKTLEAIAYAQSSGEDKPTSEKVKVHHSNASSERPKTECPFCQSDHKIYSCDKFKSVSINQRETFARKSNLCLNCLARGHMARECTSKYSCHKCKHRHHSLLHINLGSVSVSSVGEGRPNEPTAASAEDATDTSGREEVALASNSHSHSTALTNSQPILLATARVVIKGSDGRCATVRALLDQGSEASFVTEAVAQLLHLPRQRVMTTISGLGGSHTGTVTKSTKFSIAPCHGNGPLISARALVLKKITSYIPKQHASVRQWTHLRGLELADNLESSEKIDLLIGADIYGTILREGVRIGPPGTPTAQLTIFGWVLSGPLNAVSPNLPSISVMHSATLTLEQTLRKFWEVEEIPEKPHFTSEELACERHFEQTHSRDATGRYVVRLPFSSDVDGKLGESRCAAVSALSRLEKRFVREPELSTPYKDFLSEYHSLGHMQPVGASETSEEKFVYLPHHPVIKEESLTTKLRVVFNASSPTSTGVSLNDTLLIGPKLQLDLRAIIIRWRENKFVFCADIAKMFRQILVDPRDQHRQCILWRTKPDEPMQTFKLTTVTYGTASAPFLANRVIRQISADESNNYPLAAPILLDDIYVDDLLFGAPDRGLARQKRDQVTRLLASGGFELRKWASNCSELLSEIPESHRCNTVDALFRDSEDVKILGVVWLPAEDVFRFNIKLAGNVPRTKRQVLGTIAKLYDPSGWLAPSIIQAKIILQSLWLFKTGWDDNLPDELYDQWIKFYELLPNLSQVSIPRWTKQAPDSLIELHGFSDASNSAYAAVVYVRVISVLGDISVSLLIAKTKVAPLKTLSIPRLELCAGALLAKTIEFTLSAMTVAPQAIFCWTDSTVTLGWLRKQPSAWKTFVANRVSDIQTRVPHAAWRHVPSKHNPADCASRGLNASELCAHSLWWHGPWWLSRAPEEWPDQSWESTGDVDRELRPRSHTHLTCQHPEWELQNQVSSWSRLLRVTALVLRFTRIARRIAPRPEHRAVTAVEVRQASDWWVQHVQATEFNDELKDLKAGKPISKKSPLLKLDPFVDESGTLRLGGRLRHSTLSDSRKFPIILPKHQISTLIIRQVHVNTLHGGTQLTLRVLRERFWVLGARNLTKAIIHQCVRCVRESARAPHQFMGDLPAVRSSPSRPFLHTGLDYAGPFNVRTSSGRGQRAHKAYICIFVCLCTRAVHIELVHDYSTAAFLAALDRFISRRGLPSDIYCDNGTNFQGASRELASNFKIVARDPDMHSRLATDGTAWHFSPPAAPHFGGIWEAGVKSVKHHLRRMIGALTPTTEELRTLLCKIEACLNSRPIAPLLDSPENFDALTPGHFLVGTSLKAVPTPSLLEINDNRLSRWQLMQKLYEKFWRSWSHDYLHTLQQRQKWSRRNANVKVGDLVLIRNNNLPPAKWELGRILECHRGPDALVRVVSVRTTHGNLIRPITQLCILPVEASRSSLS